MLTHFNGDQLFGKCGTCSQLCVNMRRASVMRDDSWSLLDARGKTFRHQKMLRCRHVA
jgi:hypothetical protein